MVCAFGKVLPELFKFAICDPCLSSVSLTILVPIWLIVFISLGFLSHLKCI